MLWRNSLVMQDKETGSLWSHVVGEALQGALKGKVLQTLPAIQTSWNIWYRQHPKTQVLKKSAPIRASSYEQYFKNPKLTGLFRTAWLKDRMPGKKLIYGIHSGVHALAVTDEAFAAGELIRASLGEKKIIIVKSGDGGVRAFVNGRFTFSKQKNSDLFTDLETLSLWDLQEGVCKSGQLKAVKLEALPLTVAYWFAWSTYFPNSTVLD